MIFRLLRVIPGVIPESKSHTKDFFKQRKGVHDGVLTQILKAPKTIKIKKYLMNSSQNSKIADSFNLDGGSSRALCSSCLSTTAENSAQLTPSLTVATQVTFILWLRKSNSSTQLILRPSFWQKLEVYSSC